MGTGRLSQSVQTWPRDTTKLQISSTKMARTVTSMDSCRVNSSSAKSDSITPSKTSQEAVALLNSAPLGLWTTNYYLSIDPRPCCPKIETPRSRSTTKSTSKEIYTSSFPKLKRSRSNNLSRILVLDSRVWPNTSRIAQDPEAVFSTTWTKTATWVAISPIKEVTRAAPITTHARESTILYL